MPPADLEVERSDVGRQQSVQLEFVPLRVAERGALVEQRIVQELVAAERGFDHSRSFLRSRGAGRLPPRYGKEGFFDLGQSIVTGLIEVEMRKVRHFIGSHQAVDN